MPYVQNYGPEHYGTHLNPENYAVAQDDKGFMYFGTAHGVLRFDGENWELIGVKEGAFVTSLKYIEEVLYVGTQGEFGKIDLSKKTIVYESMSEGLDITDGSMVWTIANDENGIYFHTEQAIYNWDNASKKFNSFRPKDSYHTLLSDEGNIVARDRALGLISLNRKEKDYDKLREISSYGVFFYAKVNKEELFVTRDSGFYVLNKSNRIDRVLKGLYRWLDGSLVSSGLKLRDGRILINTIGKGSVLIEKDLRNWSLINQNTGLLSEDINSSFQDSNGDIWLATNKGLSYVKLSSGISFHGNKQGLQGSIFCHLITENYRLVGSSDGLYEWDPNKNRWLNIKNNVGSVWDIIEFREGYLFASSEGLYYSQLGRISKNPSNAVMLIDGRIINAGPDGVFIHSALNYGVVKSFEFPISAINSMVRDQEDSTLIWLGTFQDGLIQLNTNKWELDFYSEEDGLPAGSWTRVMNGAERTLFTTNTGVFKFISSKEIARNNEGMDDVRGYFDAYVPFAGNPYQFALEHTKGSWAILESDVLDLNGGTPNNNPYNLWKTGRVNAAESNENFLILDATEGQMWINTGTVSKQELSVPYWQYIIINKDTLEKDYFEPFKLEEPIPYLNGKLKFQFSVLDYDERSNYKFSYRIKGMYDDWTDWSEQNFVQIEQAFEGDYELELKYKDSFGREHLYPSIRFSIAAPWYRTALAYILYAVGIIVLILAVIPLARYRLKKKNEQLEEVVQERTQEISAKNVELHHQKEEILDSINYAQRIQSAILPFDDLISEHLPNSFVFFQPKDIVSGDFYWFHHEDNKSVFVCADCTGHGVPGAFMSMIGSDKLNAIVREKKIFDPGAILSELNKGIKSSLKQSGDEGSTKDGMDAAICTIDHERAVVLYSGANRNLNYIEDGEMHEIKATKAAVAGFTDLDQHFETNEINDIEKKYFYMTTDGYPDQFGGDRGKKLKMKFYKQVILDHHLKDFNQQKEDLHNFMIDWMQDYEQIDDMCVVGFKVGE
jgi:serine phosphatase RsbU (regulator of sigma subunit)/ligand-binding sensor domain-containing protein